MSEKFSLKNPKQRIREIIDQFSAQYGSVSVKCAVINDNNEQYLYQADIKIQHKDDSPIKETVQKYDNIILATISLTLDELRILLEDLNSEKLNLKSLGCINAQNSFEPTYWHIPSRTHCAGYRDEWPCYGFRTSLSKKTSFKDLSRPLVKLGLPPYPNFFEACNVFFRHEMRLTAHEPVNINFQIPDYGARINTLEIAENRISILTDRKELPLHNLTVQILCTKSNGKHQHSGDLRFDGTAQVKFDAVFVPDHVFVYLIDLKSGTNLDSKYFGSFYTDKTDGIVVKTSVEKLNSMLVAGENNNAEFKRDFDKNDKEFLESIVSFANTNDGTILLGVDDNGRAVGFYGNFGDTEKKIRGLVSGHCEPDIEVDIEHVVVDGRPVVVVKVKEGKDKPYLLSGKSAYKRVKTDDLVFERLDFDKVYGEKQNVSNNKNFRGRV